MDGDDEVLTLEAALAFIEHCSDISSSSELSSDASPELTPLVGNADVASTPPSPSSSDDDPKASTKRTRKPSGKRKPGASTLQQRRRKQEIQSLREQAGELEQHLLQLKRRYGPQPDPAFAEDDEDSAGSESNGRRSSSLLTKKQKTSSVWMELAIIQYRERQRSELTNRKLKSIWENQSKLNESIKHLVMKRSAFAVGAQVAWSVKLQ